MYRLEFCVFPFTKTLLGVIPFSAQEHLEFSKLKPKAFWNQRVDHCLAEQGGPTQPKSRTQLNPIHQKAQHGGGHDGARHRPSSTQTHAPPQWGTQWLEKSLDKREVTKKGEGVAIVHEQPTPIAAAKHLA
jgi:hypothetical protein